ncbi:putative aldouronate transport system substrate-binding protein [Paenibacillus taihuensis]|uniref:Putative aldouronate transport system substrate-binding protein n=1 Tax=Paenibacillus taihuensis TaxID=1156355 RepID=A0A3D9SE10_9BACL|nr:extracellular solute-binding protein [Paenibacillus taihuensis]REE92827.1 putative aldouronate transport system substrate-binding protein [Paenibacillus taihuensis]
MKKVLLTMSTIAVAGTMILTGCGSETKGNDAANTPTNTQSNNAAANTSTGSSSNETANAPAGDMKLRILDANVGGKTPEENTQFEAEIKRLTGIEATLEKPASDYDQKVLTALSSGEKYDLIELSDLGTLATFVDQGVLTDLTDFVTKSSVLSDPTVIPTKEWDQLKDKDGKIVAVFSKFQGGTMPIVRKDWLDKLNLKEPKTLDDYYNVLKAFKEKDPDGNGKNDTYGLSTSDLYDIQGFMSSAGLKYRYVMKDGKRTIPYATEAAVPMYEWFAKLVKEGIMDPNFVTNDTGKMRNLFLTDRVGMVTYWDAWVGMFNNMRTQEDPNTKFQAEALNGIAGADGKVLLRRGDPDFWIIPANAEHPDAAKKFLEFWHTEPGITLGSLGIEKVDYSKSGDTYMLTDMGKEHNSDHGVPFWYNENVKAPFGKLPGVQAAQDIVKQNATLELSLPGWEDAEKIVKNYALKAMSGQMDAAEAVKKMHDELMSKNLIDE